jgi:hypothetical protein
MSTSRWIQDAKIKKGALSHDLGIPEERRVPITLLRAIQRANVETTIHNPTTIGDATIFVTGTLKRRAALALTLKRMCRDKTNTRC